MAELLVAGEASTSGWGGLRVPNRTPGGGCFTVELPTGPTRRPLLVTIRPLLGTDSGGPSGWSFYLAPWLLPDAEDRALRTAVFFLTCSASMAVASNTDRPRPFGPTLLDRHPRPLGRGPSHHWNRKPATRLVRGRSLSLAAFTATNAPERRSLQTPAELPRPASVDLWIIPNLYT